MLTFKVYIKKNPSQSQGLSVIFIIKISCMYKY
nr:MAG TPA: hypothetical protein [Caudoviricetes sp.]DAR45862.1 MAG TPA: hypothetical protein [Bacteriophage sp.]DAU06416.1 MAG TPA: hypothetical protein [Caudoviricetes sp.]